MKQKFSKILMPLYLLSVVILMILLMNLNYISGYRLNGYEMFTAYKFAGFLGFVMSMFAFLHLAVLFGLIALSVIDILNRNGAITFNTKNKKMNLKKLEKIMLTVLASLSLLVLIFVIIYCASKSVYIGVGAILNTIIEILACVAFWLMDDKGVFEQIEHNMTTEKTAEPSKEMVNEGEPTSDEFEKELQKDVIVPTNEDLK